MARKPITYKVVFHIPQEEEGRLLLAKTMGDLHTKLIKEYIDKKIVDMNEKNKVVLALQKKLSDQERR